MTVGEYIDEERVTLVENVAANPMCWCMHPEIWEEVNTSFNTPHWYNATDTTASVLPHHRDLV